MALITRFDDLPDLVLIEFFSYLLSIDVLWVFARLNHRLTMLITERGFFYHINLSLARRHQFNTILRCLPLKDIQSLRIDSDASPLQLTCWPYLPHLKILSIIGAYNHNDLLLFISLHAATLTHLIIKSNERLIPDGFSFKLEYPTGDLMMLIKNIFLIPLHSLRSLDFGMNYYGTCWPITTSILSLIYLRLALPCMNTFVRLISTEPLYDTLRQLHVKVGNSYCNSRSSVSVSNLSIRMANLHTFTLVQTFFSKLRIEWTLFEILTSSKVMPVLRRANVSIFININDINRISSSPLFTDHRHVDIHFAFNLINCPQYIKVKQYIPRGNRFHSREIVGATFVVKYFSDRSKWVIDGDPFNRGHQYHHHMWYTLPWAFDEFFHEYLPDRCIMETQLFEIPSQTMITINQSCLRTLDASGQMLSSPICFLPYVALSDCIETFHFSYYNTCIPIYLSALRNITLANSTNCLNYCRSFPPTIRSIRILLFYTYPNYAPPNWSVVLHSLSHLPQRSSLRIFMYDLPKTVDDRSCQIIAEIAYLFSDFGFCFRRKFEFPDDNLDPVFNDHTKFIKQLGHCILLLSLDEEPYYSIEDDGCGLTVWL
ncbi:unnamed protein product [Rotaria sp. Silwood2]|nr:unnamed protein product [Rotaria sp. Silwood2]CAF4299179.1 unnamed protein product [Rotaria sp. Silwood2]